MRPDHPLHNPFFNRFHDPVHRRNDETQLDAPNESNKTPEYARDRFGGLFALVVLAVSFILMLKAF